MGEGVLDDLSGKNVTFEVAGRGRDQASRTGGRERRHAEPEGGRPQQPPYRPGEARRSQGNNAIAASVQAPVKWKQSFI